MTSVTATTICKPRRNRARSSRSLIWLPPQTTRVNADLRSSIKTFNITEPTINANGLLETLNEHAVKLWATLIFSLACLPAGLVHADETPPVVVEMVVEQDTLLLTGNQAEQAAQAADAKPKAEAQEPAAAKEAEAKPAEQKPSLASLQKTMRELERELQETRKKFQQKTNQQVDQTKQDAIKALNDIKLPENPTREQCQAYINEIRSLCEVPNSFTSSDPVTNKLKEIPSEHFDLLLKEIANRSALNYQSSYAMSGFDAEKLRERFVKTFDDNPNNVGIIVMHGWCEDVRPSIIKYVQTADDTISLAWFQAAVEVVEPSLYPKLHEITTQSRFAIQFINLLETLPDYDIANTIDVCWRLAREGELAISSASFAPKAAEYGNVEALGVMIDQMSSSISIVNNSSTMQRLNVLRFIEFRGTKQEIQQWYKTNKTNKNKLIFDQVLKRFIVPEDF